LTRDLDKLKEILELYCCATRMNVNLGKSTISCYRIDEEDRDYFLNLFPYKRVDMDEELKFLGFYLKPNCYLKQDWNWLLVKVEKSISS
jgi:hypothetical protein